ncbi:MAG: hypothetical protein WC533_01925 [Candidatus Pacearchaeota archaeon]
MLRISYNYPNMIILIVYSSELAVRKAEERANVEPCDSKVEPVRAIYPDTAGLDYRVGRYLDVKA